MPRERLESGPPCVDQAIQRAGLMLAASIIAAYRLVSILVGDFGRADRWGPGAKTAWRIVGILYNPST